MWRLTLTSCAYRRENTSKEKRKKKKERGELAVMRASAIGALRPLPDLMGGGDGAVEEKKAGREIRARCNPSLSSSGAKLLTAIRGREIKISAREKKGKGKGGGMGRDGCLCVSRTARIFPVSKKSRFLVAGEV